MEEMNVCGQHGAPRAGNTAAGGCRITRDREAHKPQAGTANKPEDGPRRAGRRQKGVRKARIPQGRITTRPCQIWEADTTYIPPIQTSPGVRPIRTNRVLESFRTGRALQARRAVAIGDVFMTLDAMI